MMTRNALAAVALAATTASATAQNGFVNWESPHGNPLALTPDGTRLLAVNTADNRLEIFSVSGTGLAHVAAVPVGLDPVSVRARSDTEAWVVNHVSDSVSVVDLVALNVVATILTGDEPVDVAFAGSPERAFVSVSQLNQVKVYDPANLDAAPAVLDIAGEDPRALATDGTNVFVAIFESGNDSTVLDENVVSTSVNPYPGDPNPPPNAGTAFDPPINPNVTTPPATSIIVKKDGADDWMDDNGGDWSAAVTWDLHGHDLAVIDAVSLGISYINGTMNLNMNLAARADGQVLVIGTEAMNHVRFEPNLNGRFLRVMGALVSAGSSTPSSLVDLNPHLDYATPAVDQSLRDQSLGDPRGAAWNADGDRAFITGMGSNNLVVVDATLGRVDLVELGQGPTGVVSDDDRGAVYVLNKFEGSVSVVDASSLAETQAASFHDPTPETIRLGRPHLYDTHETSGLGLVSCGACHIDGRMDQISWDLGDPSGEMKTFNQVCNFNVGGCEDWHPMKGPMATQTLIGIIGTGPLHWRADREDLAAFNGAFESLLGDDEPLTTGEMQQFEDFVATLIPPPNPHRNLDNSLQPSIPVSGGFTGDAVTGSALFLTANLDGIQCVTCHAQPTGTNGQLTSGNLLQEAQSMKIPQLRNMHEKTGFSQTSSSNNRGFGYIHDGSVDTLFSFFQFPGFQFSGGAAGDQERRDVSAFMLSFGTDTHAGVGAQVTLSGDRSDDTARRDEMLGIAATGAVGLVVKGVYGGGARGFYLIGGDTFQSDRATETVTLAQLDAAVGPGAELTYTLVPVVAEQRIGVDRDIDGHFDRDELDACADPADPQSVPGSDTCAGDISGDGAVGTTDLLDLLAQWGQGGVPADLDCSGTVDTVDLLALLAQWGACP